MASNHPPIARWPRFSRPLEEPTSAHPVEILLAIYLTGINNKYDMREIDNWKNLIEEASYEELDVDYSSIYDTHLRVQQVKGPEVVQLLSREVLEAIHRKRRVTNNRLKLQIDEDVDQGQVDPDGLGGGGRSGIEPD